MKGKPKYKVSHNQKRDTLNLYVWIYRRAADEYNQNNNTLQLA